MILSSMRCINTKGRSYQPELSDLDDMGVYAEQWADALHQWLGITDDCVHMVAKVSVLRCESKQKSLSDSSRCSGKSKHA